MLERALSSSKFFSTLLLKKKSNFVIYKKACSSVAQSAERVAVAIAASTGNRG
jgi:hypothetical protein